jgi:hypothetical protein
MINNATNINKANNHLSPQTIINNKQTQHVALELRVLACDMDKDVASFNS